MIEKNTSVKSVAYPFGLGYAIFGILTLVLVYILNLKTDSPINYIISFLNIAVPIGIYWFAIRSFKKQNNNVLSLSLALKAGMSVAVIAALLIGIYSYFHYTYIYPEFIELMKEQQRAAMINMGQMSEQQINQSIKSTSFMMNPFFIATSSLITTLFMGLIASLIIGLIQKSNNQQG
ncbi:DUF4199 domain-containing protein [Zunongwangia sp.]|uniref:DUF4199 domain-containing protein n=1 Tax=Zunongwangia sp. TaxID=1965325 RepID=UPI003AA9D054